ncbi:type VI secretion system-associated FHA domain protein TagH [Glaciimonas sp. GG7]
MSPILLTLRILTCRNQAVPHAPVGLFSDVGGTIGRAPDNLLVLDDPGKYISRTHARVVFRAGVYFLENLGSNPSVVNDRPLGKGCEIALADHDSIVIGDYQLQARIAIAVPVAPLFDSPPAVASVPALAVLPGQSSVVDALAGARILDISPSTGAAQYDPLGLNLFGTAAQYRSAESDHVSPELVPFYPQSISSASPAQPIPVASESGFTIPEDYDPLADCLLPTPVSSMVASVVPATRDSEVLQALLRGLGLPDLQINRSDVEVAETVGAMLREATAGTMEMLMAHPLNKKESGNDTTMTSDSANNPLKFFLNSDSALTQMLTSNMTSYMPPVQAMHSAFIELKAHELAVIAGMRAALAEVLHHFDLVQIESRLVVPNVMDKMMRTRRKAKMWDRLVKLYPEIAREADDDLQRLFGEKFSEAYEEKVERSGSVGK